MLTSFLDVNQIPVLEFCSNLKSMLDGGKGRKKNTMMIWGPSNTGKSFFVRALKKALIFTSDLVRSTNFKFSSFANSRLIHFEEFDPNTLSPCFQSTLKNLFEGDEELVDVKYSRPIKVYSVPIIITTNYDPETLLRKLCDNDELL